MTFEVGYNCGICWSVNMVEVNSEDGIEAAIAVTRYAADKAHRDNREDYYVSHSPLADWQVIQRRAKGMPLITITL